ncbi:hypothetical protein C1H46_000702 [Malus baccata]|uniref:F-box associated beta-propeller type 1 domain-containing protein n=1 Tax=Malus baccata TaxID=106549 RepID=A0A540NRR0_MALBA|nr:hypothetical protein C1H46_000702 [Malus baccata]
MDKAAANVIVNGALHWPVFRNTKAERNYFILKFDLGREVFRRMSLPHTFKWKFELGLRLTFTGDEKSVALFILDMRSDDYALVVWVMKEYGRKDSWTKLITLGPQGPERFAPRALGFRKCGEVSMLLSKESSHELAAGSYLIHQAHVENIAC